jgi:hypothetical protein
METFPEKVLITMHSEGGGWDGWEWGRRVYKLEETLNHHIPEVQQSLF